MQTTQTVRERALALVHELGPAFPERAPAYDREARFPFENYAELRDAGLLALCVPERYGGMGAGFHDYMHVAAELARYCPMTALTYNMHSQTVLWTGVLADELDLEAAVRERHEAIRAGLYAQILEDGAIMSQPLSEGIAKGATAGVATTAVPVDGGFRVNGRKIFASLAGAANAYNFTCLVPGEEGLRFLSVVADNPGVRIVGDWDALGMRGTDSRTLVFEDAFVPADDELLPTGAFDQLAARWPYVYLTLTPTYIGLTRAVVDFVQGYLGSPAPAGIVGAPRRRPEAVGLGRDPDRLRAQPLALGERRRRGRDRPDAGDAAARLASPRTRPWRLRRRSRRKAIRACGGRRHEAPCRSSSTTATRAAAR